MGGDVEELDWVKHQPLIFSLGCATTMATTRSKSMTAETSAKTGETAKSGATPKMCGLIMPISDMAPYPEGHWSDVKTIIEDAVRLIPDVTFKTRLVSENDASHFIQKTIIQQVYKDDIIVCDLSGHNPNVFLELGMRLAFARPVVLIVDERYTSVFDVSIIEHVKYPSDLRHGMIENFKQKLADKVAATYQQSLDEPDRKFFLEHFDITEVASLDTNRVSQDEAVLKALGDIHADVELLKRRDSRPSPPGHGYIEAEGRIYAVDEYGKPSKASRYMKKTERLDSPIRYRNALSELTGNERPTREAKNDEPSKLQELAQKLGDED